MQTENRLFDDFARMASGALSTLSGVREEIETRVRERFERLLAEFDLVTREEFEAVKEMAAKARAEQERLAARLAALEQGAQPATKKAAARKRTAATATGAGRGRRARAKAAPAKGAGTPEGGPGGDAGRSGEGPPVTPEV